MNFLSERELSDAVRNLDCQERWWCAVAFWGIGSEEMLKKSGRKNVRLICNLIMGGTNPNVIENCLGEHLKQHSTLHAKVYIGDHQAIVTSANASANGLGFEAGVASGWLEAGVLIDDPKQLKGICEWFDRTWKASREITKADIENAKRSWKMRQIARPTLLSFADFDPEDYGDPLLSWEPHKGSEWETDIDSARKSKVIVGDASEICRQIDDSIEIEGDDDRRALKPGKWILLWVAKRDITRSKSFKLRWVFTGDRVRQAGRYVGEPNKKDVVLSAKLTQPIPFDPNEREFVAAFDEVLFSGKKYQELRTDEFECWFTQKRLNLMERFWQDVKSSYGSKPH